MLPHPGHMMPGAEVAGPDPGTGPAAGNSACPPKMNAVQQREKVQRQEGARVGACVPAQS